VRKEDVIVEEDPIMEEGMTGKTGMAGEARVSNEAAITHEAPVVSRNRGANEQNTRPGCQTQRYRAADPQARTQIAELVHWPSLTRAFG